MATKLNLHVVRGDNKSFQFTCRVDGVSVNLSGVLGIRFTAKWRPDDADVDAVFIKTLSSGIAITDAVNGICVVSLVPSDTLALPAHRTPLYYDLQVTDASSLVSTFVLGTLYVNVDVSITTP